jgi:predicted ATP-grasp superfamily ATP-dependent carboligase
VRRNRPAVLLGGGLIAVSAARSLGRSGVAVYAVGDREWDPVQRSRFCAAFVDLGRGATIERRLEWLERGGPRGAVVLPCDDQGLELVARHRALLDDLGYLAVEANDEVVLAMLDKERTYELADEAGVPRPRTMTVRGERDVEAAAAQIGFPSALKPLRSHLFAQRFGAHRKVWIVESEDGLRDTLARMLELGLEMLVTEILPGPDTAFVSYYSYLDRDGTPLFHFTKRKLRQYPIGFGLTCYQTTEWDADAAELGVRFFRGVGLRGVGNVEFKRDPRDGQLKLIECNHRFTLANELVRRAGIDIPRLAYDRLVGREPPPVDAFREGVRMWHLVEDTRAFFDYRRAGELSATRWLVSLLHRQHFPLLDRDDPGPSVFELRRKADALRRRARA